MRIPILGKLLDERFLDHRRRSTSLAGIVTALLAIAWFEYLFWAKGVWSWELLTIALTFVGVKMAAMAWYMLTD